MIYEDYYAISEQHRWSVELDIPWEVAFQSRLARELTALCRERFPGVPVLWGGVHAIASTDRRLRVPLPTSSDGSRSRRRRRHRSPSVERATTDRRIRP